MKRIIPEHSKNQVKKAGKILKKPVASQEERDLADKILTNWRGSHLYPINTFRATLTRKLKTIDKKALIAQRLKRTPSIVSKLERFPSMSLPLMQDIGGLRAVLKNMVDVRLLESNYLQSSFKHELIDHKDYIKNPKGSGYRGIHLVYIYNNPKALEYNGLFIELQFRTKLQHIWATSVETIGAFINHSLKSNEGPNEWLQFFALTSAAFSIKEKTMIHEDYSIFTEKQILENVISEAERLNVHDHFNGFRIAANEITNNRTGSHHLIVLDMDNRVVRINSYGQRRLGEANVDYTHFEEEILQGRNLNIVLVATSSLESLRKAYPNYFLDTADFLKELRTMKDYLIAKY